MVVGAVAHLAGPEGPGGPGAHRPCAEAEAPRPDPLARLALAACVLLAGVLACCSRPSRSAQPAGMAARPVPVLAAAVTTRAIPIELSTFGTVQPFSSIAVKTQVTGILEKVHFQKGQTVKKGQLLFNIDPRPFQAVLDQAKANQEKDEVVLAKYRLDLKRQIELFKGGACTQDEVDQAQATADAQAAAVRADKAVADKARIDLDNCTITCPIDGMAGNLLVTEGNLVKLNDVTLVTVNQIRPIEVFFNVTQSDMNTVRQYMTKETLKVQAALPDEPGLPESGELFFVNNTVDPNSGTIRLGARFPNDDERLWPGQYVLVNLRLATLNNAIVVPSKAVFAGRDGKYVFVINPDKTAQTRPLTVGVQVGDLTVVKKGLEPGEIVVTDGQVRLTDGAKVEVQPDKAPIASSGPDTQPSAAEAKP